MKEEVTIGKWEDDDIGELPEADQARIVSFENLNPDLKKVFITAISKSVDRGSLVARVIIPIEDWGQHSYTIIQWLNSKGYQLNVLTDADKKNTIIHISW